ncbi:MAG: hypothetical protein V1758_09705, partial [Pseudomonadota bacterium]
IAIKMPPLSVFSNYFSKLYHGKPFATKKKKSKYMPNQALYGHFFALRTTLPPVTVLVKKDTLHVEGRQKHSTAEHALS